MGVTAYGIRDTTHDGTDNWESWYPRRDQHMSSITPEVINQTIRSAFPGARTTCVAVSEVSADAELVAEDEDIRPGGFVSGPSQFALADAAIWYLVAGALGRVEPMAVTSELSIRFLRPAVGKVLHARATQNRLGKRTLVATVSIWTDQNEDRPCATAQGTYALPES